MTRSYIVGICLAVASVAAAMVSTFVDDVTIKVVTLIISLVFLVGAGVSIGIMVRSGRKKVAAARAARDARDAAETEAP